MRSISRNHVLLFAALVSCSTFALAQTKSVHVTIDAAKTSAPISKYIYGQFLEHIGGIVNNNIWAEMLDDRKFYYPITSKVATEATGPSWRRAVLRHWTRIGGDEFVSLDTNHPYVGEHTPLITLAPNSARGIQQAGLAVRKDKLYSGRIVLAGAPGTSVKVTLVWGNASSDRQTVVNRIGADYRKFPLRFVAQGDNDGDNDNARLEIVGTGTGSLHIGAVSLMPADNVQGFRAEVIAALKQLDSGVYRWPGGNFVSGHEWRDAIGDPDKRPPIMDPVWHAVQPNDVGSKQAKRLNGQTVPDYLSPGDWSGNLLAHCLDTMDLLSEHFYSTAGQRFDLEKGDKVPTGPQSLIEWERAPATQVRVKYEHYQDYLKRIPALKAKRVPISLDEWAYIGAPPNSYKVVPAYAWAFHEMFRHSDLYQLGAFTFATAMISEDRTSAVFSPTGLLFKLYREHFGTIPVAVSGDSPQPKPIYPAGGDQPAVNPGSDAYPLDVVAALSEDRKTLTIAVLNPSDSDQQLSLSVNGAKLSSHSHLSRMAPSSVDATITVGRNPGVLVEETEMTSLPNEIPVPRFSVNIYSFAVN